MNKARVGEPARGEIKSAILKFLTAVESLCGLVSITNGDQMTSVSGVLADEP